MTVSAATFATRTPARVDPVNDIIATSAWPDRILSDGRPVTVYEIEYPLWNPRLVHDFGKNNAADWRDLTGLEHHRAARSDGGGDLAHDLIERPIPGSDETNHTDGLAYDASAASIEGKLKGSERLDRGFEMYLAGPSLSFACKLERRAHLLGYGFRDFVVTPVIVSRIRLSIARR